MQAADTNVWARAYLNDDLNQAHAARSALQSACKNGGIFVPILVLVELCWVLGGAWDHDRVLDTLEHIVATKGVVVESPDIAEQALQGARTGGAGFADRVIAATALAHGAHEVLTFDKALARLPHVRRLN